MTPDIRHHRAVLAALMWCAILAGPAGATQSPSKRAAAHDLPKETPGQTPALVSEPAARTVAYGDQDVIPVKTRLRYTTLIILPKNEQILDFTCGDKELWIVNGNQNFAYVKPAKAGAQTNLNLVTASGNIYSFILSEISDVPKAEPDFKVFVEVKDGALLAASQSAPRFVSAQEVETYKEKLEKAQDETRQAKQASQTAINQGITRFISNVRFPYRFEAGKKPFFVRAMYHDDRFTYIQARPQEAPALYEIKDGQPNLVNFEYRDGVYVVDKILDHGYLAIGKQKLAFSSEE